MLIRGNAKATRKKIISSHSLVKCMHINGVFDAGVSNIVLLVQRGIQGKDHSVDFCRIDNKDLRLNLKLPLPFLKMLSKLRYLSCYFLKIPTAVGPTFLKKKIWLVLR